MGVLPRDFTPTSEQLSLHGLGFIQLKLEGNQRLHVWHPDLPRRACFAHSAIHNHRFSFRSTVLVGVQINRRYDVTHSETLSTHDVISHDGPRQPEGGRLSYVSGSASVTPHPDETYVAGRSYDMHAGEYHETPNSGIVVTLMRKLEEETSYHACSLIEHGHTFDQGFDRFQLAAERLWRFVIDALVEAA